MSFFMQFFHSRIQSFILYHIFNFYLLYCFSFHSGRLHRIFPHSCFCLFGVKNHHLRWPSLSQSSHTFQHVLTGTREQFSKACESWESMKWSMNFLTSLDSLSSRKSSGLAWWLFSQVSQRDQVWKKIWANLSRLSHFVRYMNLWLWMNWTSFIADLIQSSRAS